MYQCNFNKVDNKDVEMEDKDSRKWVVFHLIYLDNLDSLDFDFVYSFKMTKITFN